MATITQGGDLMLFIGGKSIAFATSHSLEISAETSDVASKDHGIWNTKEVKTFSWTCSSENLMSNDGEGVTYADLFGYMTSKTKLDAVFTLPKTGAGVAGAVPGLAVPDGGWTPGDEEPKLGGQVIISSLSLNAPNGDNATFTVNFEGASELKPAN